MLDCLGTSSSRPPEVDPASPLLFVINAGSGRTDGDAVREAIMAALARGARTGELHVARPNELARVAREAAAMARARNAALVAVGGDGTLNAVAQAAHAEGCAMGALAQGTFNYFARTHGIPTDAAEAVEALLRSVPVPVQVGAVNERLFLVNASLGLYPEMLQDREAFKSRYGRSRLVALASAFVTMLGEHRQLRLRIDTGAGVRDVRTQTLFVGNNRLQLEQVGLPEAPALDDGCIAAVILRPIGALAMGWLLLRGALGTLGDADTVESFAFRRMVVTPRFRYGRRPVKVAFDGELCWMQPPLEFTVSPKPLYLLQPAAAPGDADASPARS